jgi:hypothetical protein
MANTAKWTVEDISRDVLVLSASYRNFALTVKRATNEGSFLFIAESPQKYIESKCIYVFWQDARDAAIKAVEQYYADNLGISDNK